ncbi:hypothetical protein TSAR_010462 [Trichomalopsis sarcophagae]|uniref:Uncharacterized protein n=1 Tax=Trichomalopsis sarcophagae TaxID=543379 RepID=A0A232EEG5_9HYME|nr:hypothetical protein TSAR_010462 [Trichomalopsis sarcophagae]
MKIFKIVAKQEKKSLPEVNANEVSLIEINSAANTLAQIKKKQCKSISSDSLNDEEDFKGFATSSNEQQDMSLESFDLNLDDKSADTAQEPCQLDEMPADRLGKVQINRSGGVSGPSANLARNQPSRKRSRRLWNKPINESLESVASISTLEKLENESSTKKKTKSRQSTRTDIQIMKKDGGYCTYCKKSKVVVQYAKHLTMTHKMHKDIAPICRMERGSQERRKAIGILRNKGLADFNRIHGEKIPLRHRQEGRNDKS